MTGPMSTSPSPSVRPTFIRRPVSQIRATTSSATSPTGIARLPAMQRSPAQPNAEFASPEIVGDKSASGMMMMWFFAPPAACTRLPFAVPVS